MLPRLLSVATALPRHRFDRAASLRLARALFGDELARLEPIFANSGIECRWTCLPAEGYLESFGWSERSALFVEQGLDLACRAATACLNKVKMSTAQVDTIVCVSTSGLCTPSLDAHIIGRLDFAPRTRRLPIFGLGCAGGAIGLARAAALARAEPGSRVLLLVVEPCTLTFRPGDRSPANMVATALFGDGAAAALLSTEGSGPKVAAWGEHIWPDTLDVMGWRIEDDGFGVLFSRDIPSLVASRLREPLDSWLEKLGLAVPDIDRFLCHPGGAKVVNALEVALGVASGTLADERAVLKAYGNMSAATLLFVVERALARPWPGRCVASALGPGFTAAFLLLEG